MKILLDECVPWPLAKSLIGHDCWSVQFCGWAGIKNGELLRLADIQRIQETVAIIEPGEFRRMQTP